MKFLTEAIKEHIKNCDLCNSKYVGFQKQKMSKKEQFLFLLETLRKENPNIDARDYHIYNTALFDVAQGIYSI